MRARGWLGCTLLCLVVVGQTEAQISVWKIGGSGLAWSANDTSEVFIDFESVPGAIQPVIFSRDQNILSQLPYWSPFKFPYELDYEDGIIPRVWRAATGFYWYTAGVLTPAWVDGDSLSYSPPVGRGINSEWYTIDVGVPVPAVQVGFYPPPHGFRADGTLLEDDIFKAFEISVSEEFDAVLNQENNDNDYHQLGVLVANVPMNYDANVQIHFPKQYVRFIRLKRNPSIDDRNFASGQANVQQGTIGELELKGEGVPKRVFYTTKLLDLGREVNFGRLFWHVTPMRVVGEEPVEVEDARISVEVEVRSGRDEDPNVYHEFTDTGAERVVSRERYEYELKTPDQSNSGRIQEGKPGLRASVKYDTENWTYWSFPITASGKPAPLERGRYLQVRVTLKSQSFVDFARLDSLWIESSPPLARQVVGEVARMDQPQPIRGFTEVELGEMTDFVYDIRSNFDASTQQGFDALRIHTGSRPQFQRLEIGEPLVEVEPEEVIEEEDELVVILPQRITRSGNAPVRVVFATRIFVFANTFFGEVFDSKSENMPQRVEEGDASEELSTTSLRVLGASGEANAVIEDLHFSSEILTPNEDGINDHLEIKYTLFRLPAAIPVELKVYGLDGVLVNRVSLGEQGAGPQRVEWDGRDGKGKLLSPGLYLVDLSLQSELKTFRHVQPVGIAY